MLVGESGRWGEARVRASESEGTAGGVSEGGGICAPWYTESNLGEMHAEFEASTCSCECPSRRPFSRGQVCEKNFKNLNYSNDYLF